MLMSEKIVGREGGRGTYEWKDNTPKWNDELYSFLFLREEERLDDRSGSYESPEETIGPEEESEDQTHVFEDDG